MTLATEPLTLDDLFDTADLAAAIDAGMVTRKQHPTLPISMYTYTAACQYSHSWTPVTMQCRGLVVDDNTGAIVALPFPKIFVTGMHGVFDFAPPMAGDEPFEVFEKADGSLIIVFHYAGRWHAASKGSFNSQQAAWAQQVLDRSDLSRLDSGLTYLAEAIYPGNRIVVDYGQREELMLLAAFRAADGTEELLSAVSRDWEPIGPVVRSWGLSDDVSALEKLAAANTTVEGSQAGGIDEEGYVIRFASGTRAKIKLAAYLTLHKLYTGTNERTVWETLATGQDPATLFDQVPDEFADWVRQITARLREQHRALVDEATDDYGRLVDSLPDGYGRREFAMAAANYQTRPALFLIHDGNDAAVNAWAWKQLRPQAGQPFKTDEEG
jgi:RNA ligase